MTPQPDTRNEEDLLILACLEPLTRFEEARFLELVRAPLDWAVVLELAALNKVEPRLLHVLEAKKAIGAVPPSVTQALRAAAAPVEAANRQRVVRACELFAELRAADIDVCVLKGVLFAETLYRDPLYKRMNDVDMLVRVEDVPRIAGVYKRLGYFPIAERVGKRPELNKKVSHHLPPYVSRELDCVLGTQWGLKSPLAGLRIDYRAIWSRSAPYLYRGIPVRKLSSRDNLFHVCVHLGLFKSGLRDLMDIANLIRCENEPIDWPGFVADVRAAGAQSLAVHALTLVQCIDPQPQTKLALDVLGPEARGFYRAAARQKASARQVLLRSCSGHLSTVENAVTAFNASKYFPEKARLGAAFFAAVFRAPATECRRIAFDPLPSAAGAALARVVAPVQILRAIGAEIGVGLLAGLLVKSAVDMGVALARWPFDAPESNDLEAWARSLGLTMGDLQRVKEAIF